MRIFDRIPRFFFSAVLVLLVAVVYAPVGDFAFVTFDDPGYVTANDIVLRGLTVDGVVRAFTEFRFANWHPLTWISHMADVSLFGASPTAAGAHHLVNVAFHAANAALLFVLLSVATEATGASLLAAALFAVHPMHVESVAWMAERKDLLSGFFGLLTLLAYVGYSRRGGWGRYVLVALLLAAGLMSKATLVTWPLVMLLFDVWPLGRVATPWSGAIPRVSWARALAEKIPLLLLSAGASIVTLAAQQAGGTVRELFDVPFALRISNAVVSYVAYLGKAVWPVDLVFLYTLPVTIPWWKVVLAGSLLVAVTASVVVVVRRRPYLPFGWFWFVGTLVPMIGIVQVGRQSMADRYAYLPFIGLYVMAAFGGRDLVRWVSLKVGEGRARGVRIVGVLIAVVVVAAFAVVARGQVWVWKDSQTLFLHLVAYDPGNGWYNLGNGHLLEGDPVEAVDAFRKAVEADPRHARARTALAVELIKAGFVEEAVQLLEEAVRLEPDYVRSWYNLGAAYGRLGDEAAALRVYERVVVWRPDDAFALLAVGELRARKGDLDGAVAALQRAVAVAPDDREALYTLARTARVAGRPEVARDAEERILALGPRQKMTTKEGTNR